MMNTNQSSNLEPTGKEAVAIFNDQKSLDSAIAELEITAFPRHEISVLGHPDDLRQVNLNIRPEVLQDDTNAPRGISVRPEEKTIGSTAFIGACAYIGGTISAIKFGMISIAALLTSLALGSLAGGAIGAVIVFIFWSRMKAEVNQQLQNGGLVLWVKTSDVDKEQIAQTIMRKHGGRNVHIHTMM